MTALYDGFLPGRHEIEGLGRGGFLFGGMSHIGSILALPSGIRAWTVAEAGALTDASLEPVLAEAAAIDFLLIGTGQKLVFLPPMLRAALRAAGIHHEAMNTVSATQTYNILMGEGRKVAAALIAIA